jgi:N-acetylglucosamine transport system permease protein
MKQKLSRATFVASFLLPAVLLYGLFVLWPVLQSLVYSFFHWKGVSEKREFAGLDNFVTLAKDKVVQQSLSHNLMLLVGAGFVILVLALLLAHAMQGEGRAMRALRGVYLFPHMISVVVVAALWMFIFNPTFGLLTGGMRLVGLADWARPWLGDSGTALVCVGVTFVWYALGFYVMLFTAALRGLPAEVNEAALLDGAMGFRRFRTITWPLLWSIKRIAIVYIVINSFNIFALVYVLTVGGPDRSTEVMLTYLYELAFKNSEFGLATALAVVNFIVVMLTSGIVMRALRQDPTEARR